MYVSGDNLVAAAAKSNADYTLNNIREYRDDATNDDYNRRNNRRAGVIVNRANTYKIDPNRNSYFYRLWRRGNRISIRLVYYVRNYILDNNKKWIPV